jgi:hypothetical protein
MPDNRKNPTLMQALMNQLRRILRKKQFPPEGDPYAYVGTPLRRSPNGRSGAAAVEIEDDSYRSFPPRQH